MDITPIHSSQTSLQAIVAAEGNLALAAELLNTTPSTLVASLVLDTNKYDVLQKYLRTLSLIRAFTMLDNLHSAMTSSLAAGDLNAREVARAYDSTAHLLERMTSASDHASANVNVFETVMKTLPPHVQAALAKLAGNTREDAAA